MKCPICGKGKTEVENTRSTKGGETVWRRRLCTSCKRVFSTYETPALDFLIIKKRNGKKTRYASHKLLAGIFNACASGKNPDLGDAAKKAQEVLEIIEKKILATGKTELSTKEIIHLVGEVLEKSDSGAFYRYGAFSDYKMETLGL